MRMELVCPKSKTPLEISGDMLVSREGNKYPIKNGVPRFVEEDNYSNSFGEQWNMFSETQLDSYLGKKITENRLTKCFGPDLWGKLENKSVLECGCGAGRFTEILLKQKASVCSVDFSCAVDANVKNCQITDEHKVFQADILDLPFKEESFDLVLCLGVIQHTPDPEKTIAALYRQVKPGGFLIIDHYKYLLSWYLHPVPIIRFFLKRYSRKSPKACMKLIRVMVNALFPIHWKLWNIHPSLNWLLNRISPVISYFAALPELNEEQHKEWSFLDTHDSLTDWYKHRKTVKQVAGILEGLGVENIECRYGGNGVEAKGQRPQRELYKNPKISKDALQYENIVTSKAEMKVLQQQMVEAEKAERAEALKKVGRRNDTINNIIRLFSKKAMNILINLEKEKLIDRYKSYTGRYCAWRDSKGIKHDEKILFVDLGANVGQAYKCFSNYFNQKNISFELFEPNPFCYEKLLQLPKVISGDVVVKNVGVGPKAGTFKFYGLANSEGGKLSLGGSIVKQHNSLWYSASSDTAIDIELINFIDYLNEKSKCFDKIIVKMDIESAEVELLEALIENQAINHISILYVDFHSQYQEGTQSKTTKKREGNILSHIKEQTDVKFRMWH